MLPKFPVNFFFSSSVDVYSSFSHVDNRGESVNLSYTTKKRNMVEFKEFHQFEDQGVNFSYTLISISIRLSFVFSRK